MPRYPTRMTAGDWAIAVAMAFPFAVFLALVGLVVVFG